MNLKLTNCKYFRVTLLSGKNEHAYACYLESVIQDSGKIDFVGQMFRGRGVTLRKNVSAYHKM